MPGGRLLCALLAAFAAVAPCTAFAQITVDGTLSPARSLAGPHYSITADLGQQLGANLFHSFGQFNLSTGESATFSGPNSVANIIARVRGGSVSSIDGTIASTIPGANLFLINPAGLMFGPNAQVNVSGSFHATTADYLRFADGAVFSASTPSGSTLTTAAPSAFGFLSSNPAGLSINGSTLSVPTGQQLSLVGGPVTINGGTIQAAGGAIHVASASGPGQIPIDPTNAVGVTAPLGSVNIAQGSAVDASASGPGQSGGQIYIRGGIVAIDASTVETANAGAGTGGGIAITGSTSITLSSGSDVEIDNSGSGAPGSILLQGGAITMSGFSTILSQNYGPGPGAPVTLNGTDMTLTNGAQVTSSAFATGNSGDITVTASGSVTIDGSLASPFGTNTGFGTMVQPGASGNSGNITVSVADTLTILAGGAISSETAEAGNAGNVTVTAGTIVTDDASAIFGGIGSIVDSPVFYVFLPAQPPDNASGSGGNVSVQAAQISITGSAEIGTFGYGMGNPGNVVVNASGTLLIDGSSTPSAYTGVFSQSISNADTGTVTVQGNQITVQANGQIAAQGFFAGNVGNVSVTAGSLTIDGTATPTYATGISTLAIDGNVAGGGAAIGVTAGQIRLVGGGTITASTEGMGQSGNITVTTTGGLTIANNGQIVSITDSAATGNAGSVSVTAPAIAITNTGEIGSNTFGSANAGAVTVNAGTISIMGPTVDPNPGTNPPLTGIASDAELGSTGNGGSVNVAAGQIDLYAGGVISSTTFGSGQGGQVTVTASSILANGSGAIDGLATAIAANSDASASGNGGVVVVDAGSVTLQNGGTIASTSKGTGNGGSVTTTAGDILIEGSNAVGPAAITAAAVGPGVGSAGTITIFATSLTLLDGGLVSTRADPQMPDPTPQGGGGDLFIHASKLVDLANSHITTSVLGGNGNGGNITIDPPALVLKSSSITANAFGGNGGNILIDASVLLLTPDSFITASSQLGISGTITVNAPANDVTAGMTPLSGRLAAAQEIARAGCADVIRREKSSSLAAKGQGGLPPDASEPLSLSYLDDMPVAPLAVTTNDGSAHVASTLKLACR